MYKHILVPLDGSAMAETALGPAAFLAQKLGARITLFHVIEQRTPRNVHGEHHLQDRDEADAYLEGIAAALPAALRVTCHVHEDPVSNVTRGIVDHEHELDHDLIVMCSHGRGRALNLMLGSIAQQVLETGKLPVLMTFPPREGQTRPFDLKRILCPLDGNPEHEGAFPVAQALARATGAFVQLVTVIPRFHNLSGKHTITSRLLPVTTTRILDATAEMTAEYLEEKSQQLDQNGVVSEAYVLEGDPAGQITRFADTGHSDLIVMATHGRSGMNAFWSGSMASRICSCQTVPFLLIPVSEA